MRAAVFETQADAFCDGTPQVGERQDFSSERVQSSSRCMMYEEYEVVQN